MDAAWSQMIAAMQASGRQAVLAITGGGTGAIAELLRVPGGSRLLLEAIVPYDPGSLRDYLGADPEQACSAETAVAMAERARRRAAALGKPDGVAIGLGATASLASDRPKRGDHRCHIAVATAAATDLTSIVLEKGLRDRAGEEDLVARAITLCLARGCDIPAPPPSSLLAPGERSTHTSLPARSPLHELLSGAIDRVTVGPDGRLEPRAPLPSAVMPGSFNPRHDGHTRLAQTAAEILGTPIHFELSVLNVDKPALTAAEVRRRLDQFAGRATVELTRAPTFLEKSRIFPNVTFVIGADTAERLVAARYYGDSEAQMLAALEEMAARGARFLVAARRDAAGRVHSLADAAVPARFAGLFTQIPESRFRVDISSTALRAST
jgi:nicotinic acid mononucleotide adenylyltransferase/nicotinamide mononucleotide (NMN) deamidase PncC